MIPTVKMIIFLYYAWIETRMKTGITCEKSELFFEHKLI